VIGRINDGEELSSCAPEKATERSHPVKNEIIFYSSPEGDKKVEVMYQDENFWLTQKGIAQLFNVITQGDGSFVLYQQTHFASLM